jgi:hypothetical protein
LLEQHRIDGGDLLSNVQSSSPVTRPASAWKRHSGTG